MEVIFLKKILFTLLLFAVFFTFPTNGQANSNTTTIELTQNATARFTLSTGEVIKYADLMKGQRFLASQVNDQWQIQIGNASTYIPLRFGVQARVPVTQHKRAHKLELISTSSAAVYSSKSNKTKPFATLAKDMRISSNGRTGNYYEVIIGARKGYIHHNFVENDNGVPILIYHHFVKNQANSVFKNNTSVSDIDVFREQMNYLSTQKFTTISLKDFDLWTQKKQALPGKAVALTFDDANLSLPIMIYPILKEKNMYATSFVITGRTKEQAPEFNMETVQFSGINELRQMMDRFDLEYHTHALHSFDTVTNKSALQYTSNNALHYDFVHANEVFKQIDPNIKPRYFSYPFGIYDKRQERVYIQHGVSLAFLNKGGKAPLTSPRLYVPRVPIQNKTTVAEFKKLVNN